MREERNKAVEALMKQTELVKDLQGSVFEVNLLLIMTVHLPHQRKIVLFVSMLQTLNPNLVNVQKTSEN